MRVLCTAGHVDHGKSTLVRALTGREPDRLAEEQRRGLTIDLGFAWTRLDGVGEVAFVDLPGHERFVPNMLAGAGPVRTALLVVAADEGWMPQSAEHLAILELLQVRSGVVALTRTDLVDAETAAISAELVREELAGTGLAGAPVVPVSGVTGAGLDALRAALADVLAATPPPADLGRARLWVDRAFTVHGAGTVVTGTLGGGAVAVGDQLVVQPGGTPVRVRGVQSLEQPVGRAEPGWRVALNLVGVDVPDVPRGSAVTAAGTWAVTAQVDAWCTPAGVPLGRRGAWRVHVGTAELGAALYPVGGADLAAPGPVRIQLEHALPLAAGDRLVLRDAGRRATVGGGVVLDPLPRQRVRGGRARQAAVERLQALAQVVVQGDPAAADERTAATARLGAVVADRAEVPVEQALAVAGAPPSAVDDAAAAGTATAVGGWLLAPDRWRLLADLVVQAVLGTHQRRPALAVVARRDVRHLALAAGAPDELVDAVVDRLLADGRLEAAPGGVRVPGHEPRLSVAQQVARTRLLALLDEQAWEAAPLPDLAAQAEADDDLLTALEREGELVLVEGRARALSRGALDRAAAVLAGLPGPFTAAQARDVLGTSRRWALPLLEALDATGRTRRDGDVRTVR